MLKSFSEFEMRAQIKCWWEKSIFFYLSSLYLVVSKNFVSVSDISSRVNSSRLQSGIYLLLLNKLRNISSNYRHSILKQCHLHIIYK